MAEIYAEIQAEHDSEIQAFLRWHSTTRRPGIGGSNHATPYHFIPFSAVKEYLGANQRVERLLAALFVKNVDAQYVREHYLRPLAILLLIGQGPMIQVFVRYLSLMDHRLPFRTRPEDFPRSSDSNLFDRFHSEQWQFCAADLEYNMDLNLHKEEILPITHKEEIGWGGNAKVFKIVVDKEYNKLVPHHWQMPERPPDLQNTFVLKTYRGLDAKEQHKNEQNAFKILRHDGKPSPFIVAYYGSFIDDDTYNIILEYADKGNLENFMRVTPPPSTPEDMIALWERLCKITHGLAVIHGYRDRLLGWHQDIKPGNILIMSGSGTSSYDVYFKLADLTSCHFTHNQDFDRDVVGTRAYGAPETFRSDRRIDPVPVSVKQNVDIWSMGCVFSEAAVWSRFGWNRLLEYRCRRTNEIHEHLDLSGEEWFHDEHNVLRTVRETHEHIANTSRLIHRVIVKILQLVNKKMLLNEHEQRASAIDILTESTRIIDTTRKTIGISITRDSSRHGQEAEHGSDFEERPITPPNVPPGYMSKSGEPSHKTTGRDIEAPLFPRPLSWNRTKRDTPKLQTRLAHRQHQMKTVNGYHQAQVADESFGPFHSGSNTLHDLPDPPSPAFSYHSSDTDASSLSPFHAGGTHQGIGSQQLDRGPSSAAKHAPLRGHRLAEDTTRTSSHFSNRPTRDHSNYISAADSLNSDGATSSRTADNPTSSKSQAQEHEEKPPHVSLSEGLRWKRNKKQGLHDPLHGEENLSSLNIRDHIFVIDNTKSMLPHRNNAISVVSLLGYIVKDSDPNGLDVYFTQSTHSAHSSKSTDLSMAVSRAPFQGISNMRARLGQILQEHIAKFGTTTTPSKSWYKWKPRRAESHRPLSFYVLTDGRWQPQSDVGPVIKSLVESMKEHRLLKEHVGIQFIRFGDDPQAKARLEHLDHGLGLQADDMDIVDTTPWDGNIWKHMLGALNPWYDDDPD
ncbi:MAG: hypothetical protein Q9191_000621 [Dirinaria sp. TL-2023a]